MPKTQNDSLTHDFISSCKKVGISLSSIMYSSSSLTHSHSVAKTGLTILDIFFYEKHFLENIWRRNVDQESNNNSPSNIL